MSRPPRWYGDGTVRGATCPIRSPQRRSHIVVLCNSVGSTAGFLAARTEDLSSLEPLPPPESMIEDAKPVLAEDPVMAELLEKHDLPALDEHREFERLCVSIINQQLSSASAAAVRERVFEHLETVTPAAVLDADEAPLRDAGLSGMKIEYLQHAAAAFQENNYSRAALADHSAAEVIDELTDIRGIGEWTSHMYLLFVLQREDVLPLGDLAIRNGIEQLYAADGESLTREEMRDIAAAWRPYRSVAARYIWAEYEAEE